MARSRILLRSAQETDSDIGTKLKHQEQYVRNVQDPNIRASYFKLKRDYTRAHDNFKALSIQYKTRQQEAIGQLQEAHGFPSEEEIKMKVLAREEVCLAACGKLCECRSKQICLVRLTELRLIRRVVYKGGILLPCHARTRNRTKAIEPKYA